MKFPTDTDSSRRYTKPAEDSEYNDDATMSPIGRLMDDGDEPGEPESGAYVSGFDRRKPAEPEAAPTRPAPIHGTERERERPGMRERERSAPTPSFASDEDFFEMGSREATRRERERRRPTNPNPRPAVRATVPTQRRMSTPPAPSSRPAGREVADDANPDEVYDTFRQRYNPDDLISAGKGGRTVRREPGDTRGPAPRPQAEEEERINPARVAVAGGAFAFLLLLIILVIVMNNFRIQRNYYRAQVDENAGFRSRYYVLRTEATGLYDSLVDYRNQRNNYRAQVQAQTPGTTATDPGDNNDLPGNGTAAQPPAEDFPRQHEVMSRQNLTIIARIHYGAERVDRRPMVYTEHIRNYNNMPNDQVNVGRIINIPAPPPLP